MLRKLFEWHLFCDDFKHCKQKKEKKTPFQFNSKMWQKNKLTPKSNAVCTLTSKVSK